MVALVNATGTKVVEYTYDAWGKVLTKTGSLANSLGTVQPFRYRGYVYDEETGLYYLRSRYYKPQWNRFLNVDGLLIDNQYIYCDNNPLVLIDPNGYAPNALTYSLGRKFNYENDEVGGGGGIVSSTTIMISNIFTFITGPIIALVDSILSPSEKTETYDQSINHSITDSHTTEKADSENQKTYIYRYGGLNNLKPRYKDRNSGLSFSTVPQIGAAVTTIEAINVTGVVYAIQDSPTHVSVRPIGGTMDDWIQQGSQSIWTQAIKSIATIYGGFE